MIYQEVFTLPPSEQEFVFVFNQKEYTVYKGMFYCYSKKFQKNVELQQQSVIEINLDVTDDAFETFINACQGKSFNITQENILDLFYLASFWEVQCLEDQINKQIFESNNPDLVFRAVWYKIEKGLPTNNEERCIAEHLETFLEDERMPRLPIPILKKVLYTYQMSQIAPEKKLEFLKKCLLNHGKEAASSFADLVNMPLDEQNLESLLKDKNLVLQPLPHNLAKQCFIESKRKDAYKSIANHLTEALTKLVNELVKRNIKDIEMDDTISNLKSAMEIGDVESPKILSTIYDNGIGVEPNTAMAEQYMRYHEDAPEEIPIVVEFPDSDVRFDINEDEVISQGNRLPKIRFLRGKFREWLDNFKFSKRPTRHPRRPNQLNIMRIIRRTAANTRKASTEKENEDMNENKDENEIQDDNQHEDNIASAEDNKQEETPIESKQSNSMKEEPAESSEMTNKSQSTEELQKAAAQEEHHEESAAPITKSEADGAEILNGNQRIGLGESKRTRRNPMRPRATDYSAADKPVVSEDELMQGNSVHRAPLFKSYDLLNVRNENKGKIPMKSSKAHLPYLIEDSSMLNLGKDSKESLEILKQQSEAGDKDSSFILGVMYSKGIDVDVDISNSIHYYERAMDQGDVRAMFNLGTLYEFDGGENIQNYDKAREYYQRAADLNDKYAQTNLGTMYYSEDVAKAAELFEKAAAQGDSDAQANLGIIYFYGKEPFKKDLSKAFNYFEEASKAGDPDAQVMLGVLYEEGFDGRKPDYEKAVEYYRKSAEQGNPDAQFNLGIMYENGYGVERDVEKTIEWYTHAANNGNSDAMYNLAVIYQYGIDDQGDENKDETQVVHKNPEKAKLYYEKSANEDNVDALFNLGVMNLHGAQELGIEQNNQKAIEFFTKAAELDCVDALFHLGTVYENENQIEKAIPYYEKAADLGSIAALFNLGVLYINGSDGLEPNREKSIEYFKRAADLGDEDAKYNLEQILLMS